MTEESMKSLERRIDELEAGTRAAEIGQLFSINCAGWAHPVLVTQAQLGGMPSWCRAVAEPIDVDDDMRREIARQIKQGLAATMEEARRRRREQLNLAGPKQA